MSAQITDLDNVVKEWAWTTYFRTTNWLTRLNFEDAVLEIARDNVKSTVESCRIDDSPKIPGTKVIFKTTYKNETEDNQEHSFKTERETVCTCTTRVVSGFTKSYGLDLSLAVPQSVLTATAKFGKEVRLDTTDEKTVAQKMTWSVDSKISAPAQRHTIAELEVNEDKLKTKFHMDVKMKGKVIVNIRKAKNNQLVRTVENDIATVLRDSRQKIPVNVKIDGATVVWPVTGEIEFSYGVSQNVVVKSAQMSMDNSMHINPEHPYQGNRLF